MQHRDRHGLALSGANAAALDPYEEAQRCLDRFAGDPITPLERAIEASPAFVMAHVTKAWLFLVGTEAAGLVPARTAYEAAHGLPANDRERGHLAALSHVLDGAWRDGAHALEDVSIGYPLDTLALQAGQILDMATGDQRMLRDRVARAAPFWDPHMPDRHVILGMQALGLEENGDYRAAERLGRRAVELEPRNGWARHAVAHVFEMEGRPAEGVAWLAAHPEVQAEDSLFRAHNSWHLALYHVELGDAAAALALYDGPIRGGRSPVVLDLVDASALLWRLALAGHDVGDRWSVLADVWAPQAATAHCAFNDMHAAMAFVGAGRRDLLDTVRRAQAGAIRGAGDNARVTAEIGRPVTEAIRAFGEGDWARVVHLLRPVRRIAQRFGGSHAQRDVLDLTLIEAAIRSGDGPLGRALAAVRAAVKPNSRSSHAFLARAA
jgi:hypothetical protein